MTGQTLTLPVGNAIVINLTGDLAGGAFTVDTPSATVNNSATNANITITDVSSNTWNENASGNTLTFNDPDTEANLVIGAGQTVASLTLGRSANVTNNGTIAALTVEAEATGAIVTNNSGGTIGNVTANGYVLVNGAGPTGTTSGSAGLVANADELAKKVLEAIAKGAKDYTYTPAYKTNYKSSEIVDNVATVTYKWDDIKDFQHKGKADPGAAIMNDTARYLGALIYNDSNATIKKLAYSGEEYIWGKQADGKMLSGSNWRLVDGENDTLINQIKLDFFVSAVETGKTDPEEMFKDEKLKNEYEFDLIDENGKSVNFTLKFNVEF